MEKRTPHYPLTVVKTMIETGKVKSTMVAREGATAMGFSYDGMLAVVVALTVADSTRA
jgi:motility quorum-sensing regulator/GCU-specific mRNA interferase toxin